MHTPSSYAINFKEGREVAMKATGYKKLHVTDIQCITTNGNKWPLQIVPNKKRVPKEHLCNDSTVWTKKVYMNHKS
jgi:hypothetical protein